MTLDQALRPGDDQDLGIRAAPAGGATRIERIGGAAGSEHHVEGYHHHQGIGPAIGHDVAMMDRQRRQEEQDPDHPRAPAEGEQDPQHGGDGEDYSDRGRILQPVHQGRTQGAGDQPCLVPLEQAGVGEPVVHLEGHERQVGKSDQAEDDPEETEGPGRDRAEPELVPCTQRVHGFTSRRLSTRIVPTIHGLVGLIGSTAAMLPGGGVGRTW